MTKEEFMNLFVRLCAAYGKEFSEPQAVVYYQYLGACDRGELERAVDECVMAGEKFFPTIAELNEKMAGGDVGESWRKVVEVARGGCRGWRILTDIEVATINTIGGMADIQNANDQGLHFIFKEFVRTYPIMQRRRIKYGSDMDKLKGLNMVPETFKHIRMQETELPKRLLSKNG